MSAPGEARLGRAELAVLALAALLYVASSADIVRQISPHWDDYFLLVKEPWETITWWVSKYGGGRPVGILINAAFLWPIKRLGVAPSTVALVARWATIVAVYALLRRSLGLPRAGAVLATVLFAGNAPAGEGWAFYNTSTEGVSAIALVAALGAYARVLAAFIETGVVPRRLLMTAVGLQLLDLAIYEQPALAIPGVVALVLLFVVATRRAPLRGAVAIAGVCGAASVLWMAQLLGTGYLVGRHRLSQLASEPPPPNVEPGDVVWTAAGDWRAFVMHHLWRGIELLRIGPGRWFTGASAPTVAALLAATIVVGVAVWRVWRRSDAPTDRELPWWVTCGVMLVGCYLATLPFAIGFPHFVDASRAYYLPGVFFALAVTAAAGVVPLRGPLVPAAAVAAATLWTGATSRKYLMEIRQGAELVRHAATAYQAMPEDVRRGGVLIMAPDVLGTFDVAGFNFPESAREALSWTRPVTVGPLYWTYDCTSARGGRIRDLERRIVRGTAWQAVLVVREDGVPHVARTIDEACAGRS